MRRRVKAYSVATQIDHHHDTGDGHVNRATLIDGNAMPIALRPGGSHQINRRKESPPFGP